MYTVDKYRSTFFRTTSSTYRDCRNAQKTKNQKKQLRSSQRGFANIQKVPLHLMFFCFITVMSFCASVAVKKRKHHRGQGGTTPKHCHVSVRAWS